MDNLEQQCEDVLFELCDARERYPLQCANEFEKCIKLKTDIYMMKVENYDIIDKSSWECDENFNIPVNDNKICFKHFDHKLRNIINKLDDLKDVMDQIEREKICFINKLLQG